ncbi:MAG: RICIN domain-containing protein [Bacilli bacterium]
MKKNIIIVLFVIIFLSIGYSAFTTKVQIGDISATVRIKADIRITDISIDSFKSSAVSSYEDYNVSNITSKLFFPNADSEITYKIEITNLGNSEMGILSITGIPDNMEYSLSNYNLKDKICDDSNKCSLGIKKEILLTIKYKDGGFDNNNINYNLKLDFDFRPFYTITYNGYDDTTSYPKEVLEGDTLEVNLGTEYAKYTKLYVNSIQIKDYTSSGGIIRTENISGNVSFHFYGKWVYLTYSGNTIKKSIDPNNESSLTFDGTTIDSGVVVRCNNGAVPIFKNNIVTSSNITTETTCQVFDSFKESVESSDNTINNILQIRNESPTVGQIDVASNKTIYYDINGMTINYVVGSDIAYIINNGNLTISDKVGTGLLKADYRLIQSHSKLTINSGNYKRENSVDSVDGGVVQIKGGVASLKNSTFITDKTWAVFASTNGGQIIDIENCTISSEKTFAVTNATSNGIINILNSTITSNERSALGSNGGGPIYVCKSSLNASINDFTSNESGKLYYASDVTFKNQSNSPTVDNSDYAIKNYINNCSSDWYKVKSYDSSGNEKYVTDQNGEIIKVGDKVKLVSKVGDSSTYVMDVDGAVFETGRNVQIYENNNTNAQQYTFLASSSAGYYNIAPYSYTSLFINIQGATSDDGANIMLYNGSDAVNERFKLIRSNNEGYHYFRSSYGTNIDVDGGTAANYQNVQSWTPNSTDAQNWKTEKVS